MIAIERIGLLGALLFFPVFVVMDQLYCRKLGTTDSIAGSIQIAWEAWLQEWRDVQ